MFVIDTGVFLYIFCRSWQLFYYFMGKDVPKVDSIMTQFIFHDVT